MVGAFLGGEGLHSSPAYFGRVTLPETESADFPLAPGLRRGLLGLTFKPFVQTFSTSLVYRF